MNPEIFLLLRQGISETEDLLERYRKALSILEEFEYPVQKQALKEGWKPTKTGFDFSRALSIKFLAEEKPFRNYFDTDFLSERSYYDFLESLRWKDGVIKCPHCGSDKSHYIVKARGRNAKEVKSYRCAERRCDLPFTVKTGTIMDGTKISLHKWLLAAYFLTRQPKITSIALAEKVQTTQKTAWYLKDKLTK